MGERLTLVCSQCSRTSDEDPGGWYSESGVGRKLARALAGRRSLTGRETPALAAISCGRSKTKP
jgi:hypothetical protein